LEETVRGPEAAADEALLVGRARRGDQAAFCALVERHQRRVYAVALRIVRRHDLADDVAQEAFVRAWQSLSSFDLSRPFAPWIARIARNQALNVLRARAEQAEPLPEGPAEPADPARGALDGVLDGETEEILSRAVQSLPDDQRRVLLLRASGELSYEEIAAELGIAQGTVMSRLSRARQRLRELLGPWLRERAKGAASG
jgi:RNA polymerase sigma-70 factor (ECF subfamily)